jgi:hypothetical protein
MLEKLAWELGRPHVGLWTASEVTTSISGSPVKWSGKPLWGVGGAHNTYDGKDNITLSEGRSPTLFIRPKKVRVRECRRLTTP